MRFLNKHKHGAFCPLTVLCTVDLSKHKDLSLQLEKVGSDPYCEMSVNSEVKEKINVAAGTKASLSFLDCPDEDVRLTANQIISKNSNIQRSFLNKQLLFSPQKDWLHFVWTVV